MSVNHPPTLHHAAIYDLPVDDCWKYHAVGVAHLPGGLSLTGPSVWNSLPDYLREPEVGRDMFRKHLKTFLFARY